MEGPSGGQEDVITLCEQMLALPLGPKVEVRRWFTFYDAGGLLDRVWHSMLLALFVWYLADGKDPEEVAAGSRPIYEKDDNNEQKNFKFRVQVLMTLANRSNQRILRSMLATFRILRLHMASFIKDTGTAEVTTNYLQIWADEPRWIASMLLRTMEYALFRAQSCRYMGQPPFFWAPR